MEKGFSAGSGLALWRETRRGLFLQVPFRNFSYRCLFKLILQVLPQLTLTSAFSSYSYRRFSFPHLCATFNSHLSQDSCLYSRMLRLCPLGKSGKRGLTEKCFQRLPLRFLTNKTWIRTLHRSGKVSRFLKLKRERNGANKLSPPDGER